MSEAYIPITRRKRNRINYDDLITLPELPPVVKIIKVMLCAIKENEAIKNNLIKEGQSRWKIYMSTEFIDKLRNEMYVFLVLHGYTVEKLNDIYVIKQFDNVLFFTPIN